MSIDREDVARPGRSFSSAAILLCADSFGSAVCPCNTDSDHPASTRTTPNPPQQAATTDGAAHASNDDTTNPADHHYAGWPLDASSHAADYAPQQRPIPPAESTPAGGSAEPPPHPPTASP